MFCYWFLYSNISAGGFFRNMNIMLGDILLIFILYSFQVPKNLLKNIVFPGKQGIYLENGIRPPFLFYKLGRFFLQVS